MRFAKTEMRMRVSVDIIGEAGVVYGLDRELQYAEERAGWIHMSERNGVWLRFNDIMTRYTSYSCLKLLYRS